MVENQGIRKVLPILLLGGLGVGGYFIWKKYFKKAEEKEGFIRVSSPLPTGAKEFETIIVNVFGKNNTKESHLCFIKIIDKTTMEPIVPMQSVDVGAGITKQFNFEFTMREEDIRLEIQTGRIINGEEIIDSKFPWTIKLLPPEVGVEISNFYIEIYELAG